MLLARRNLAHDQTRLLLSIAGVALSVMLILLLSGYLAGIYRQASAYLENTPGSTVVSQHGVRTFAGSSSFLSPDVLDALLANADVDRAIPIVMQCAVLELHDRKEIASLIGYEVALGGGPWDVASGREPAADDEVVMDRVLADQHGIKVGDQLEILDREMTVVGLSNGTSMWIGSISLPRRTLSRDCCAHPAHGADLRDACPGRIGPGPSAGDRPARHRGVRQDRQDRQRPEGNRPDLRRAAGLMVAIAFVVASSSWASSSTPRPSSGGANTARSRRSACRNRPLYRLVTTPGVDRGGRGRRARGRAGLRAGAP